MTSYSRLAVTTLLGYRDIEHVLFSASRTFWPFLMVVRRLYGHPGWWVRLPAWGFILVFYCNLLDVRSAGRGFKSYSG